MTDSPQLFSVVPVPVSEPPRFFSAGPAAKQAGCCTTLFKRIVRERRLTEFQSPTGWHIYPVATVEAVKNEVERRQREREALR